MMKIKFDTTSFANALSKKAAEIQAATRPAAQAGAQVIYDQARLNVPVSKRDHFFYGKAYKKTGKKYLFSPGTLRDSIYQVYSKTNSAQSKATYHISWNHTKAPYGFMVEFGTSRAPAHPFLGPAIHDKSAEAAAAMKAKFLGVVK
jgi:HK97 gp10 family phage protein